jgi:arylsulfatase
MILRLLLATCALALGAAERSNVLVILADDLGYSDLGAYGGEIPTPNLDRLAKAGARFEKCYNSAAARRAPRSSPACIRTRPASATS